MNRNQNTLSTAGHLEVDFDCEVSSGKKAIVFEQNPMARWKNKNPKKSSNNPPIATKIEVKSNTKYSSNKRN